MTELVRRALAIAETQVGVREHGRNRGPEIDGYCHDIGHDPAKADPWCAIFVCAMFKRAADQMGIHCPVPLTAGCFTLDEHSPPAVRTTEPVPGAIFLLNGHRHTGLVFDVLDLDGDLVATIEGNTSKAGIPDGDGVYKRTRRREEIEIYLDFSRLPEASLVT